MLAFPETLSAPLAVGSRTMIDWLIVIVFAVVLLARKLLSPEYDTVIEWVPGDRDEVLNVATPPESVNFPRSSPVVVSKKSTLPVGVPEPGAIRGDLRGDRDHLAEGVTGVRGAG